MSLPTSTLFTGSDEFLTVASGYSLSVGGGLNFAGQNLYVRDGGTVTFNGTGYSGAQFGVVDGAVATFDSGSLTATGGVFAGCEIDPAEYFFNTSGTIDWNSPGTLSACSPCSAPGTATRAAFSRRPRARWTRARPAPWWPSGRPAAPLPQTLIISTAAPSRASSLVGYTANSQLSLAGGTLAPASGFAIPAGSLLSYTLAAGTVSTIDTGSNDFTWAAAFPAAAAWPRLVPGRLP